MRLRFATHIGISSALASFAICAAEGSTPVVPRGVEALDWAFKFASSIDADPADKGKAQQATVMDYAQLDALDLAIERAAMVEGWRRGVVYADLALELSREDRKEQARELLRNAEEVRKGTSGWQGPRIEAHVAQALVSLGEEEHAREIAGRLAEADARQYLGRTAATLASAQAGPQGFERAMQVLRALDASEDLETAWWRTMGYLELGRQTSFDEAQRKTALTASERSAASIAGWKRAEVLTWLSVEWRGRDRDRAKALLEQAEALVLALPHTAPARGPLLAEIASGWKAMGDEKRGDERFAQALSSVPRAMTIDQPEIYGLIAASYASADEPARARELFDRALTLAGELENSRPRALSVTAILRSMAKARVELDGATRARLIALEDGLGDPW